MICYPEADNSFLLWQSWGFGLGYGWLPYSDLLIRVFMQLNPVNMDFRGWELHPFQAKVHAESKKGL